MSHPAQRTSCDECRRRKLKCSGAPPDACERCCRERIDCFYSAKKRMGRPRKARLQESSNGGDAVNIWNSEKHGMVDVGLVPGIDSIPVSFAESMDARPEAGIEMGGDSLVWPAELNYDRDCVENALLAPTDATGGITLSDNIEPALVPRPPANDQGASASQCACLPGHYLAAADLQSTYMLGFPSAVPPLRVALRTAQDMLQCPLGPTPMEHGRQNIMLLYSLLSSIASGFDRLLRDIDKEAKLSLAGGRKKTLRTGDNSPENLHRHTGRSDCPVGFNLDLEPNEWRILVTRLVKKEIYDSGDGYRTLEWLLTETEKRQISWHTNPLLKAKSCFENAPAQAHAAQEEESTCLKLAYEIRKQIIALPR